MELYNRNRHYPFIVNVDIEDSSVVRITVIHARSYVEWMLDISSPEDFVHLHPDLETAENAKSFLNCALKGIDGLSVECSIHDDKLKFTIFRQSKYGQREGTLWIPQLQSQSGNENIFDKRLDYIQERIERLMVTDYFGDFSFDSQKCHETLVLFHNNTAVRKKGTGATGPHAGVFSVRKYNNEVVYWEFRVVCIGTRAVMMIGVAPGTDLGSYAGHNNSNYRGASLYLYHGHIYKDGQNSDYGLQPKQIKTGTYVGLLLDTYANTVKFSINGEFGNVVQLDGPHDGYYVAVSLYDGEECIEILPSFCKKLQ